MGYTPAILQYVYLNQMARLQFVIIGCGKIAPRHAAEIVKHGQLAAVCDIVPGKANELARTYNCKAYFHTDDLIAGEQGSGIAAICTPNGLHAAHSIQFLRAGYHVLCEKPLSISVLEADKMIKASEEYKKKLFVVKSTRYNPAIAGLKKILDENKLGKLFSFQLNCFWNRPPAYYTGSWKGTELDGGTLYTQFSHYIDALLWLFGDVKSLNGYRKNLNHKDIVLSEDTGVVTLEMQNGMIGGINWSVNAYMENMEVSLTVIAEKGSIRLGGSYMNKIEYQLTEDSCKLKVYESGNANHYGFYKGSMSNHDQVYANLIKALNDDSHPFTGAADGLKTVALIERIYNSVSLS